MSDLSAAATLDLWQAAEARSPVERALALAAAAAGGSAPAEDLAALPIGRRDARILRLHAAIGGGPLEATARCPECGEDAEFAVDPAALAPAGVSPPAALIADGYVVEWRSPDSRDFAAAAEAGDAAAAERVLLERCVTAASGPDGLVEAVRLPAGVRSELAKAMADSDPLAEVLVDVTCPACGAGYAADVDLGEFVWAGLQARAHRLLREVDVLARTYGWTEPDVLALDDRRRAAYLELAREDRP